MNAADITKLVSKLRFKIQPQRRRFPTMFGPMGRLTRMSDFVTAMIKYERIEMYYPRADETRGYLERLISEAIRHGDQHAPTMAMADFWIKEKQYVHKLFKVIVPRLQNCPVAYTKMYKVPITYPDLASRQRAVLELRGNPFPALKPELGVNRNFIHNVLLDEAKKEYRRKKYAKLNAESVAASESAKTDDTEKVTDQSGTISIDKMSSVDDDNAANDTNKPVNESKPTDQSKATK